ncbi:MAG: hypothetical protein ACJ71K_12020 [Nitrososphaeraceae archaeon]
MYVKGQIAPIAVKSARLLVKPASDSGSQLHYHQQKGYGTDKQASYIDDDNPYFSYTNNRPI